MEFAGVYGFIYDFVHTLDYAVSYVYWICWQPYDVALGYLFGSFDTVYFTSLIYNINYSAPKLYIPIVAEVAHVVINGFYGWIDNIFPNILFGGCLIVGTIVNFFTITIIHWSIKLFT